MSINTIFLYLEFEFSVFGLGKNSVSVVNKRATIAISVHLVSKYIKPPCTEEQVIKMVIIFHEHHGFPKCMGAVDGVHIPVKRPTIDSKSDFIKVIIH